MKHWLLQQGFAVFEGADESLNKKAVENLLAKNSLPDNVRHALELRQLGGKSSVAKYQAMRDRASADGRVRGNLMYCGASTGRFSGQGVQIQNLPRETPKDWDASRVHLPNSNSQLADLSKMIRGCIIAAPGTRLMWADYAAIEARGVAWIAGQKDLVQLFHDGADVYCDMASEIYGRVVTKADPAGRFLGKSVILGCGYSMGAARFRQACAAQGQDISEELAQHAVGTYRTKFAKIPLLWRGLNDAIIDAVEHHGMETFYRNVQFIADKHWLLINLPSNRKLFYRQPRIVTHAGPFGERPTVEYMAQNQLTRQWGWERSFGGKWTENIVQGICRDLICDAMTALEAAGYPVIASVHDEVICEVPNGHSSIEEMIEIMCRVPAWATGFPINAEGKEAVRYGK
jgi:DNA polymerase